ncbi:Curli production assembly/transport component CsgG/holdfast attachment protein HfaB (fragment) [Roseovarius sp. EC-HK134]|uniref:CsgG/HfaB family protein n=1 Tax=unclassified Roseovarius TaxID=2614913 RepID=UPI00125C127F
MTRRIMRFSAIVSLCTVAACAAVPNDIRREALNDGDVPLLLSSKPTSNVTPFTKQLVCYGEQLKSGNSKPVAIAVGNIRDYTGKQSDLEGYLVTQGGALMAYTALGHLVPGISLYERFDTQIADAELAYLANRQLGNGGQHETVDQQTGETNQVPWMPYYGGSVLQSDYFIVGGITELNFNIQSGGAELGISGIGAKARIYTMNVGLDLRIVGSQSLRVHDTVSIQKQITGYEVGADIFRFFDDTLWDVNSGAKNQEPLHLAVRMAIESALLEIVPTVTGVPAENCDQSPPPIGQTM